MNRLASLPSQPVIAQKSVDAQGNASNRRAAGKPHPRIKIGPHATFAPLHYESGYAYPLLIWLHGAGGNETQLRQLMPQVSMRNYVGVAPRGTFVNGEPSQAFAWNQTPAEIELAEERVFNCLNLVRERFHIHSQRVFVAGFGCGGTMAIRVAWNHPQRFAGAAAICGPLPQGMQPMTRINDLRHLPLLLSSGRDARRYSERKVCNDLRLMHAAGLTVALRQYPCGDEMQSTMLSDLDRWMMDIVCD